MNNKQRELMRIVDAVVSCCCTDVDNSGTKSLTADDVLGKSRAENVVMTRAILVSQVLSSGYSVTTCAQLLCRTAHAVRHLNELGYQYMRTSRAYRIAHAESTLLCKDIEYASK